MEEDLEELLFLQAEVTSFFERQTSSSETEVLLRLRDNLEAATKNFLDRYDYFSTTNMSF